MVVDNLPAAALILEAKADYPEGKWAEGIPSELVAAERNRVAVALRVANRATVAQSRPEGKVDYPEGKWAG